jgi:hypothetical protein
MNRQPSVNIAHLIWLSEDTFRGPVAADKADPILSQIPSKSMREWYDPMSRRWWIGLAVLGGAMAVFAVLPWLAPSRLEGLIGTGSLLVSIGSLVVSAVALRMDWSRTRATSDADDAGLDRITRGLAQAVYQQWTDELETRRLNLPNLLKIRWTATEAPVVGADRVVLGATAQPGHLRGMVGNGDLYGVAGLVGRLPARRLVIVGRPGAGKTVLAVLFTVAQSAVAVDSARHGKAKEPTPVPVLLTLAGWNPRQEHPYAWLARRISEDYPLLAAFGLGVNIVVELLRTGRIIPVLDGLDEMPTALVPEALTALNAALREGHGLVLTCRIKEYEQAVAVSSSPLSRAAVIHVEPVTTADAIDFLTASVPAGDDRWEAVANSLAIDPHGPLSTALSTPLTISLARSVYADPARQPAELCDQQRLSDAAAIEGLLLGAYLPTVYAHRPSPPGATHTQHPYRPDSAAAWLRFLSRHLRKDVASPDLAWWHLARAVPVPLVGTGVAVATAVATAPLLATYFHFFWWLQETQPLAAMLALAASLVTGRRAATAARSWRAASSVDTWNLIATAIRDAAIIAALTTPVLWLASTAYPAHNLHALLRRLSAESLTAAAFAGLLSLLMSGVTAGHAGGPRRIVPRPRGLPRALASGTLVGLAAGLPIGLTVGLLSAANHLREVSAAINAAGRAVTVVTLCVGLPVGIGRWLRLPVERQRALTPRSVLHSDLAAAAVIGVGASAALGSVALLAIFVWGAPEYTDVEWYVVNGTILALATGVVMALGCGTEWITYRVALAWLALQRKVPWRLMRFLDDAHQRGVLRRVGATYQLRHARLEELLAGDIISEPPPAKPQCHED